MVHQDALLNKIIKIARQAANIILKYYSGPFELHYKRDKSPVTVADEEAHELILSELEIITPNVPVVSEECENENIKGKSEFWLVDPLDGTKEFIQRKGEFTVNISLIKNNLPVLGVICAPALNVIYAGIVGGQAFKITSKDEYIPLKVHYNTSEEILIVTSRNHRNPDRENYFLSLFPKSSLVKVGSSLKFCKIAEGIAHIYPRFGRTMEWDTAAGQAVLMAAGGMLHSLEGEVLTYGKKDFENPHFIAASSFDLLEVGDYGY